MSNKNKREREGWVWNEAGSGGYWTRMKSKARHSHKLDFFCPYEGCIKSITGTIDDPYLLKYGICKTCYVMYVEDRENPLIDVGEYARRVKERGN